MGTNFYWYTKNDEEWEGPHIGKRSAAGMFCWSCNRTLCIGGPDAVHEGHSGWHDACPSCGARPVKEGLKSGPAAVELGFAEPRAEAPTDVRGASSFTWAQEPDDVLRTLRSWPDTEIVIDEYGRKMTGAEFTKMLDSNCPIRFTDSIGREFS